MSDEFGKESERVYFAPQAFDICPSLYFALYSYTTLSIFRSTTPQRNFINFLDERFLKKKKTDKIDIKSSLDRNFCNRHFINLFL